MRNSISIFGQGNNDLLLGVGIKIKNSNGDILASTSPVAEQIEIHDNNDGTYYFDVTETFRGTVYVGDNETAQDEMTDVLWLGDDALAHLADSGIHVTAAEKTKISNLPDDTSQDITDLITAVAAKAAQSALDALTTAVSGKASNTPGTGMTLEDEDKIIPDLNSDYLEIDANGKIRIKQQFANEDILSNSKTLIENLARLQSAIQNIDGVGSGGSVSFLNLTLRQSHITSVPLGQAQLYFYYSDPVAASGTYGLYVAYNVDGSTVQYTIKESTWGGGTS
jgi:hypothetical protein